LASASAGGSAILPAVAMPPPASLPSLVLGAALGLPLAACGGGSRCDPDQPDVICTIAGSGVQDFAGDGGPATEAALYIPMDTAVSPDGEVWVLDFNNYVVRAIDADGVIRTVIGNGQVGDSPPPGVPSIPALEAFFNHTTDLIFQGDHLYLAAWHNSRIKRVRLSDMTLESYAGRGRRTYYDGDEGPALTASLDLPASLALDPAGNLVLMDQANQVLRMIDGAGVIHRIAGTCIANAEECLPGEQPAACSTSPKYAGSNKLACGNLDETCALNCTPGFSGDGGPALEARMAQPYGAQAEPAGHIAYDHAGNLLFADFDNHRIRKVDRAGVITTIAGTGTGTGLRGGYSGDGGPATQAQLNGPHDLAIGPDDTIYFTDVYNNCVRQIDPAGIISTVVGRCGPDFAARGFDGEGGPPLEAKLDRPYGLDLVGKKLYVTDSYNNRVRALTLP
jgi:DNA-binding beta-propeller fold protein YncE